MGWPTNWMIYGWLIDWITDSFVHGLTNWLNDYSWLIDCLTDSTVQVLNNWLNDLWLFNLLNSLWVIDWLTDSTLWGTDQLTEWFMADCLTDRLYYPRTDKVTKCSLGNKFIDPPKYCMTNSSVWVSTSWLNDLWLIDWVTDWLSTHFVLKIKIPRQRRYIMLI